jgi:hypothetical protein
MIKIFQFFEHILYICSKVIGIIFFIKIKLTKLLTHYHKYQNVSNVIIIIHVIFIQIMIIIILTIIRVYVIAVVTHIILNS